MMILIAAAFACDSTVTNDQLSARVDAALVEYEAFEVPRFQTLARAIEDDLVCSNARFSSALAARVHLTVGLLRWSETARDKAALAWSAARHADPALKVSDALFPRDSAERTLWDGTTGAAGPTRPLPPSSWVVDGKDATVIPVDRPAVTQELSRGLVARSAYVWPGGAWPPEAPTRHPRTAPLVAGVASLAVAGVGAGLFVDAYATFQSDDYKAGINSGDPEFSTWWKSTFAPEWYGGITCLSVGVAGLAASGVWLALTPSSVGVRGTF